MFILTGNWDFWSISILFVKLLSHYWFNIYDQIPFLGQTCFHEMVHFHVNFGSIYFLDWINKPIIWYIKCCFCCINHICHVFDCLYNRVLQYVSSLLYAFKTRYKWFSEKFNPKKTYCSYTCIFYLRPLCVCIRNLNVFL